LYLQAVEILHFVQDDTKKQFCKRLKRYIEFAKRFFRSFKSTEQEFPPTHPRPPFKLPSQPPKTQESRNLWLRLLEISWAANRKGPVPVRVGRIITPIPTFRPLAVPPGLEKVRGFSFREIAGGGAKSSLLLPLPAICGAILPGRFGRHYQASISG
jgi:hypothetical protein